MRKLWKAGMVYVTIAALLMSCGLADGNDVTGASTAIAVVEQQASTQSETSLQEKAATENTPQSEEKDRVKEAATEAMAAVSGKVSAEGAVEILLSDTEITVNGETASADESAAVYTANDIVYYEMGKDFTYGEGTAEDEHTAEEAASHTVVHITQAGTYVVSGKLSAGQIAIDLGDDAEENPEAVVTLILNGVDINCSVAPGVIFYDVYECGDKDNATKDVDTSKAGANVIIADGSVNNVTGSYVARIYKSVELNEAGTAVVDSKKLHKYDAAFYSKMTMNVNGGAKGTGILNIQAENEGLDSELHLTINGGNINITAGNDGINTNEDGVSVTTVNGGTLTILADGATGEGDGIDSNGWLVINGGTVISSACAFSGDAGIDSDRGIHINGGTVVATGNMLDHISESAQNYAVFTFAGRQLGGTAYTVKNTNGDVIGEWTPINDFIYLIISSPELVEGTYNVWANEKQLAARTGGNGIGIRLGMGDQLPEGMTPPEGMEVPEGMTPPEGKELPEGMTPPEDMELPTGEMPQGMGRPQGGRTQQGQANSELLTEFEITAGGSYFSNVSAIVKMELDKQLHN